MTVTVTFQRFSSIAMHSDDNQRHGEKILRSIGVLRELPVLAEITDLDHRAVENGTLG